MISQFTIVPVDYAAAAEALLSAARRDPAILVIELDRGGNLIVLCSDADDAAAARAHWDRHGTIQVGLSVIELLTPARLILVEQGEEFSQARLARFLGPLLQTFAFERIFDRGAEVVLTDPSYEALFVDDDDALDAQD